MAFYPIKLTIEALTVTLPAGKMRGNYKKVGIFDQKIIEVAIALHFQKKVDGPWGFNGQLYSVKRQFWLFYPIRVKYNLTPKFQKIEKNWKWLNIKNGVFSQGFGQKLVKSVFWGKKIAPKNRIVGYWFLTNLSPKNLILLGYKFYSKNCHLTCKANGLKFYFTKIG